MNDEARRFRKEYEVRRPIQQNRNARKNVQGRDNIVQFQERYTAKKGTARRAKERKKKPRLNLKIASLILAAGIGLGGITVTGSLNKEPEPTVTQMQEMGVSEADLGLEQDTLEMMERYDEYFENFDPKTTNLTDNDVIEMIEDIRTLNFNVIKDKMADLRGVERGDVKLYYNFNKGDGGYYTAVKINEDQYSKREIYNNDYGVLFGLGKEDTIPQEIADLIVQIGSYESIVDDLKADHITKANAIRELEKLYRKISDIAVKDFSMDDKGNVELTDYEAKENKNEKDKTTEKEGEEI